MDIPLKSARVALAAICLTGCGGAMTTSGAVVSTSNSPSPSATAVPGGTSSDLIMTRQSPRPVDWDHLLVDGMDTTAALAATQGELPFTPLVPVFDSPPIDVQVSDPKIAMAEVRTVFFAYDLPRAPAMELKPRVVVMESLSESSDTQLEAIPSEWPADSGYEIVYIANRPVLVNSGNGVSRARFNCGKVMVDITGPAVTRDVILSLVETFPAK